MRGNELLEKMELADARYIEEAEHARPFARSKRKAVFAWMAACLALVAALGCGIWKFSGAGESITLENGSVLTLRRTGAAPSQSVDIDTSRINVRELTAEEGARFFGMDGVSGTGYFDREDNSLIGFSGQTESGVRIHLSVQDKFPRDVVIMSDREALIALGDGVTGFGGYFVTDANSRGERNAIYYAALCFGEVNVYLEAGGTLAESEMTKAELTAAINALVRQGWLSFDATEVD